MKRKLQELGRTLGGELHFDSAMRTLYATDASAYRELPLAVAIPADVEDLRKLVHFARENGTSLIPRTAGTSLAGQVVGNGIVVDVSRKFTRILEIDAKNSRVRLQPGVVRDELNYHLAPLGLYFGPETSTANRAMVGGMVGNNSCGSNSVVYGSARDHLLSVKALLSDGSDVEFKAVTLQEFEDKCVGKNVSGKLEQQLYKQVKAMLGDPANQQEIRKEYPKPQIPRRNTGYAIDLLLETEPFTPGKEPFNFCKLIAGSEGTLCFIYEIELHVNPLPPRHKALVCAHFNTIDDSLKANLIALKYRPSACELMDHYILECTKTNIEHRQNRFFVQGDPEAILVVEISCDNEQEVQKVAADMEAEMRAAGLGYHFPMVQGNDIKRVWNLRKAGLGLLSNIPGDAKPAPVIEDTAVDVNDLPAYIADFNEILKKYELFCVHYAHAGSGELHLRPILDLKTREGNQLFRTIATEIAHLVKKYKGSLSGEHGDGRLRGEFIQFMVGEKNYQLLKELKQAWDPQNVFNPGKIVDTPSMNSQLRYEPGQRTPDFKTVFDFNKNHGILRATELCNGSGDCRKTEITGGTMCPSYMATRNEKDTTRARANVLREFLTRSNKSNPFDHEEIKEVMDLCLSCKGCKSECPSNVDLAKLKAEFQHQYYQTNGVPLRARLVGNFTKLNALAALTPGLYNFMFSNQITGGLAKSFMGFAEGRSMPLLHKHTLRKWYGKHRQNGALRAGKHQVKGQVILFCDEFTNFNDTDIGEKAVQLLEALGYEVLMPKHLESGRTYLSKGLLREAKDIAVRNIDLLKDQVSEEVPVVGIEPSAVLTLRDEYLELCHPGQKLAAEKIAENTLLIDEFIARERDRGNIKPEQFTDRQQLIKLHGHCHQKALSSLTFTKKMLTLPQNYQVHLIRSGCCGMAGSFGYEKEHYDISMQIGELVLLPQVRKQPEDVLIAAPGTSCRHQIKDGTGRKALHPVEILYEALRG